MGLATNRGPERLGGRRWSLRTITIRGGGRAAWIYQLNRARVVRGEKVILDDVILSFLPGAKIGVVGPNGAGKSTLLRVMAGLEQPSNGDARPAPDISVGWLPQEPVLDEHKTVLGNVSGGVADTEARLARYTLITTRLADDYSDELMNEMGRCRSNWTISAPGISTPASNRPWTRCAAHHPTPTVTSLSGGERRRVALCRLLCNAQSTAARRADQPSRRRKRAMAEAHLAGYPGTVIAVTHDRYFLDNVAQWILELDRGHAYPYQGNYTFYLDTKAARLHVEGRKDANSCVSCSRNSNGFVLRRWPGRRKAVRGCAVTTRWRRAWRRPVASKSMRSIFRRDRGWATS